MWALFLLLGVLTVPPKAVHGQMSEQVYLGIGPAGVPGYGAVVSVTRVGRFVTRDVVLLAGYRSRSDGSIRAAATIGGGIRILGGRRTVLDTPRGRLDFDLGFRLGPAVLFRFQESEIDRNRRFTLLADPFVRVSARRGYLFSAELAVHRPALRVSVLVPL